MFTGGTIWILTHGYFRCPSPCGTRLALLGSVRGQQAKLADGGPDLSWVSCGQNGRGARWKEWPWVKIKIVPPSKHPNPHKIAWYAYHKMGSH